MAGFCVQVDLIICFDASASPIRNIQRIGRTGRHRAGRVLYILAAGKEMDNYARNQEASHEPGHPCSKRHTQLVHAPMQAGCA